MINLDMLGGSIQQNLLFDSADWLHYSMFYQIWKDFAFYKSYVLDAVNGSALAFFIKKRSFFKKWLVERSACARFLFYFILLVAQHAPRQIPIPYRRYLQYTSLFMSFYIHYISVNMIKIRVHRECSVFLTAIVPTALHRKK